MNIDSELIKNKRFEEAISDELVKVSQEYRVLAVLRYIFPSKHEQMKHGDKPDLQDKINRIGIEVTAAVQENDMKANRTFVEMGKNSSDSQRFATKKITECGYEINSTIGLMSISKYGTSDSEKTCLHNAIINKCKKLTNIKKIMQKLVWLFCFLKSQQAMLRIISLIG